MEVFKVFDIFVSAFGIDSCLLFPIGLDFNAGILIKSSSFFLGDSEIFTFLSKKKSQAYATKMETKKVCVSSKIRKIFSK